MFNIFNRRVMQRLLEAEKTVEIAKNRTMLIDIERKGRMNVFVFMRGRERIEIETVGLLSDNIQEWRDKLL